MNEHSAKETCFGRKTGENKSASRENQAVPFAEVLGGVAKGNDDLMKQPQSFLI
jgi:hypothetical protein